MSHQQSATALVQLVPAQIELLQRAEALVRRTAGGKVRQRVR